MPLLALAVLARRLGVGAAAPDGHLGCGRASRSSSLAQLPAPGAVRRGLRARFDLDPALLGATLGSAAGGRCSPGPCSRWRSSAILGSAWRSGTAPSTGGSPPPPPCAGLVLSGTAALVGHAAAGAGSGLALVASPPCTSRAMTVWLGGLAGLLAGLLRPATSRRRGGRGAARLLPAGLRLGGRPGRHGNAAVDPRGRLARRRWSRPAYGWLLVAKLVLVLVILAAAGISRVWVQQRLGASAAPGPARAPGLGARVRRGPAAADHEGLDHDGPDHEGPDQQDPDPVEAAAGAGRGPGRGRGRASARAAPVGADRVRRRRRRPRAVRRPGRPARPRGPPSPSRSTPRSRCRAPAGRTAACRCRSIRPAPGANSLHLYLFDDAGPAHPARADPRDPHRAGAADRPARRAAAARRPGPLHRRRDRPSRRPAPGPSPSSSGSTSSPPPPPAPTSRCADRAFLRSPMNRSSMSLLRAPARLAVVSAAALGLLTAGAGLASAHVACPRRTRLRAAKARSPSGCPTRATRPARSRSASSCPSRTPLASVSVQPVPGLDGQADHGALNPPVTDRRRRHDHRAGLGRGVRRAARRRHRAGAVPGVLAVGGPVPEGRLARVPRRPDLQRRQASRPGSSRRSRARPSRSIRRPSSRWAPRPRRQPPLRRPPRLPTRTPATPRRRRRRPRPGRRCSSPWSRWRSALAGVVLGCARARRTVASVIARPRLAAGARGRRPARWPAAACRRRRPRRRRAQRRRRCPPRRRSTRRRRPGRALPPAGVHAHRHHGQAVRLQGRDRGHARRCCSSATPGAPTSARRRWPTSPSRCGAWTRRWPRRLQVVFVTTDPAHDTPAVLGEYLHRFDADLPQQFIGLTGDAGGDRPGAAVRRRAAGRGRRQDALGAAAALRQGRRRARRLRPGNTPRDIAADLKRVAAAS